jgi:hypothetical protein
VGSRQRVEETKRVAMIERGSEAGEGWQREKVTHGVGRLGVDNAESRQVLRGVGSEGSVDRRIDVNGSSSSSNGRGVGSENGGPVLGVGGSRDGAGDVGEGKVGRVLGEVIVGVASLVGDEGIDVADSLVGVLTSERAESPVGLDGREGGVMGVV